MEYEFLAIKQSQDFLANSEVILCSIFSDISVNF